MRNLCKATALLLAVFCLTACSLIQVNNDRVTVAEVGTVKITLTEFMEFAISYFSYVGVDPTDSSQKEYVDQVNASLLEMIVQDRVSQIKMEEFGVAETAEDRALAEQQVTEQLESMYQVRYDAFMTQEGVTEEEAVQDAQAYVDGMFNETYTVQDYIDETVLQIVSNKLIEKVTADVVVSDDEIRAEYDSRVQASKDEAANGLASFETYMGSEDPYYVPDGYFYVKHILIAFEDGVAEQINSLRTEDKEDEAEALRDSNLSLIQERADEALAKVEEGEDFETLIAEYGEDPGMDIEPYKTDGYIMYEGNESYMQEFYDASIKLTEDGMTTGLVATDYGYHIIRRVSTLESYTKDYDSVKDEISETLLSNKRSEEYQTLMETWKEEIGVKTWPDRISYT